MYVCMCMYVYVYIYIYIYIYIKYMPSGHLPGPARRSNPHRDFYNVSGAQGQSYISQGM